MANPFTPGANHPRAYDVARARHEAARGESQAAGNWAEGVNANARWMLESDPLFSNLDKGEALKKRERDFQLGAANNAEANQMIANAKATGDKYSGAFGDVAERTKQASLDAQTRGTGMYAGNLAGYTNAAAQAARSRGMQTGAYDALQQFAAGPQGPSSAQAQLTQATAANTANALAMARSGRGMGGSAAAMRQAIGQNAATQQQAAGQMAQLRADENTAFQQQRLAALGQMGGLATQTATTDQGLASLGLNRAQYESDVALKGQQLNDQSAQAWANQQAQALNAGLGAEVGAQTQELNIQGAALNARQAEYAVTMAQAGQAQAAQIAQQQRQDAFTNAAIGTAGTVISGIASDERTKQDITPLGQYKDSVVGASHPAAAPTQTPGGAPSGNSVKVSQPQQPPSFTKMASPGDSDKASDERAKTVGSTAGKVVGGVAGAVIGGPIGAIAGSAIGGYAGKALGKVFSDVRSKTAIVPLGGGGGYDFGDGFVPLEQERIPSNWERDPNNPSRLVDPYRGIAEASHSTHGHAFAQLQEIAKQYPEAGGIATSPQAVEKYATAKPAEAIKQTEVKPEELQSRQPAREPNQSRPEKNMSMDTDETAPAKKAAGLTGKALQRFARDNTGPILSEGDALLADSARNAPGAAYQYKDPSMPGAAPGVHTGPMAQDLEAHPITAGMVLTDRLTGMKKVDGGRAAMTSLAQNHSQQNQLDKLHAEMDKLKKMVGTADKVPSKNTPRFTPSTNWQGL